MPLIEEEFESQHIDEIHPELIILAALILAVKFLDDHQQSTKEYAEQWGRGIWSCQQVNFTQRCLLENLGYRLLPLWEEDVILEALEAMERAGSQYEPEIYDSEDEAEDEKWDFQPTLMMHGKAMLGLGNQITPVETPRPENIKGTRDVTVETRTAFNSLPDRTTSPREPFPLFMEPGMAEYGF